MPDGCGFLASTGWRRWLWCCCGWWSISMELRLESSDSESACRWCETPLGGARFGMSGLEMGLPVVGEPPLPVLPVPTLPRPESDLAAATLRLPVDDEEE